MRIVTAVQSIVNRALSPLDLRVDRRTAMGADLPSNVRRLLGRDPAIILDVGANVGQTRAAFRAAWPGSRIISFEPSATPFRQLVAGVAHPLSEAHQLALSDEDGEVLFREFPESTANSMLAPRVLADTPEWVRQATTTRVPARRIDGWCEEAGLGEIDLLKIDTQGADLRVLRGAEGMLEAGRIRAVYFEVIFSDFYDGQCSFPECHELLARHGYRLVDFYEHVRAPSGAIAYCNALYVHGMA